MRYIKLTCIQKYRGLFRSSFILELIAGHYDAISGAIRIPEFEPAFSRDQQKLINSLKTRLRTLDADSQEALEIAVRLDTMRMYPRGALAFCITAVNTLLLILNLMCLICLIIGRLNVHWAYLHRKEVLSFLGTSTEINGSKKFRCIVTSLSESSGLARWRTLCSKHVLSWMPAQISHLS